MKSNFIIISIIIIILSLILNWFVQLLYYLWSKQKNSQAFKGQKTLLNYYTGYLGDGVIVPVINVLIYFVILKIGEIRGIGGIRVIGGMMVLFFAYTVGLVLDFLIHLFQGKLKLTNWSMSTPFHWNFAGYWHMFSFPIQMGYIALFFWVLMTNLTLVFMKWELLLAAVGIIGLMLFFCWLYGKDNKWI